MHYPHVAAFVADLGYAKTAGGAFNPWGDCDPEMDVDDSIISTAAVERSERLTAHLSCYPTMILIGEAPGYQGCRYSGVPFTSERLILEGKVPRVSMALSTYERITTREKPWSEPSATIVWNKLYQLRLQETTVMWNAFPFHPHREGEPLSNATPTVEQLLAGREWLERFLNLPNLKNAEVLPVGRKAAAMLSGISGGRVNPNVWLRHPANGGARKFAEGLAAYARRVEDRRFGQPHYGHP